MSEKKPGFVQPPLEPKPWGGMSGRDTKYPFLHRWLSRQPEARHQQNWGILGGVYGGLLGGLGGGGTGALVGSGQVGESEWFLLLLPTLIALLLSAIITVIVLKKNPGSYASKPIWRLYQASYSMRIEAHIGSEAASILESIAAEVVATEGFLAERSWEELPAGSSWAEVRDNIRQDLRQTMERFIKTASSQKTPPADAEEVLEEVRLLRQEVEQRTLALNRREGAQGESGLRENLNRMRLLAQAEAELHDSLSDSGDQGS